MKDEIGWWKLSVELLDSAESFVMRPCLCDLLLACEI